jgi:hypothetical protein
MQVNCEKPWLRAVRWVLRQVVNQENWREILNQCALEKGIQNHCQLPIQFVSQSMLPEKNPYEAWISQTGCVPTRGNLHDFFNALVWLSFPKIKKVLNELQAAQIQLEGIKPSRGKARDAATLFDENAVIVVVKEGGMGEAWCTALREHRWTEVFIENRGGFGELGYESEAEIQVWGFGHALMEKLEKPYKAITAHAWIVRAPEAYFLLTDEAQRIWVDESVARNLLTRMLNPQDFSPLPVLGIPEWFSEQNLDFYMDKTVFRDKSRQK